MKFLVMAALLFAVPTCGVCSADNPGPVDLSPVNIDSIYRAAPEPDSFRQFGYVYLLDKGDAAVSSDLRSIQTFHSIALVSGQDGIRSLGTEVIAYELGHDSVIIHKALVTSASGQQTAIDAANILYDIRPSHLMANDLYTHERQVRVVFPGLEIGSKVELQYSLITYAPSMNGISYRWSFSLMVPSRYSLYSVAYPTGMAVHFRQYNFKDQPIMREVADRTIHTWTRKEIPAQVAEPNGLPFWDLAEHVDLTTFDSWADFGRFLYDSLWQTDLDALLDTCELRLLEELSVADIPPRARVAALYHAVQERIRYLGLSIDEHNLKPYPSAVICKLRYGDCKDQCNFLVKLLRHAGVECYPAVVATWGRIFNQDTGFAAVPYFNHVVVHIPNLDGKPMWLDPTSAYAAVGWVAPVLVNRWAIVVDRSALGLRRIEVTPEEQDLIVATDSTTLDTLGSGIRESEYRLLGRQACQVRSAISAMNQEERSHLCDGLGGHASATVLDCQTENLESLDSVLVLRVKSEDKLMAESAGGLLLLPSEFSILKALDIEELRTSRVTDLHLPGMGALRTVRSCLAPDGYRLRSAPTDFVKTSGNVRFEQKVERLSERCVRVRRFMEIRDMYVPKAGYDAFREFIRAVDQATSAKLIFEKVN